MSALSDNISAAGLNSLGQSVVPGQSADAFGQALQTSRAKVDLDQGVKRVREAASVDDRSRVIGGVSLQNYDPLLSIRKGDILLVDLTQADQPNSAIDVQALDGRPTVYSSLAGYVVPTGIRTEAQWRRSQRVVGFAPYDSLIENAKGGQAPHYGTAIVTGGSMASTPHVVPEPIGAGELLVADIGPLDPFARNKWSENFQFNRSSYPRGCEKAVLRPYNPYAGVDFLGEAMEEYLAVATDSTGAELNMLSAPAKFGVTPDPLLVAGASLAKPLFTAIWMGVALLAEAGYVTLSATPATLQSDTDLFDFAGVNKQRLAALASRLSLDGGSDIDRVLMKSLFGAFYQPLTNDYDLAEYFSMKNAIAQSTLAQQLQDEGSMGLITTVTDAYYTNAALICAKAVENSKQGKNGLRYVVTQ